jgi:restriction endonuclease
LPAGWINGGYQTLCQTSGLVRDRHAVGKYNPDWAILKEDDQGLYLLHETKATRDFLQLRTSEADKVRCGQRHCEALGIPFAVAVSAMRRSGLRL